MRPPSFLRSGTFWMALQAAVVFAAYSASPVFEPILRNDSRLYVKLARHVPVPATLESIRTPAYPLMLRGTDRLCRNFSCLPEIQLALYCLAAVGLCAALRRYGLSEVAAAAGATPLLYSPLVPHLAPSVMTDVPAAALAVGTVSLLLALLAGPRSRPVRAAVGLGLGLGLFLSYLVRPAYLFLVALVPVAGLALPLPGPGAPSRRRRLRRAAALAALSLAPLLLWCTLRWVAVGHFGPVSFTGYNLVGLAGSMLDEEAVAALPQADRDLAELILTMRRRRGLEPVDAGTPFAGWREPFIVNSWRIAIPAARKAWREETGRGLEPAVSLSRDIYVDRRLTRLSVALIRDSPGLYLVWLARAWGAALWRSMSAPWIWGTAALALAALAAGRWVRGRWRGQPGTEERGRREPPGLRPAGGFLVLALGYYLLSLGLVLLVEPPEWRYLSASQLLLPGALAAVGLEKWRQVATTWKRRGDRQDQKGAPPPSAFGGGTRVRRGPG